MFQPQPTPYSPFSSTPYGIGMGIGMGAGAGAGAGAGVGASSPASAFPGFQPSDLRLAGTCTGTGTGADSGGPSVFRNPIFSPAAPNSRGLTFANNNILSRSYKMEGAGMHDLEAQEAMARDFQPALEGPLVGEKKSSHAITEEYAKADPVYVAKTAASIAAELLPLSTYTWGWQLWMAGYVLPHGIVDAVGFSYFETLLRLRNKVQLEGEVARMTSLNNYLSTVGGFEAWLFEDMVEETTNLLKDMANLIQTSPQGTADLLFQRFNDPDISNAIVYHFRLLASSWLKGSPADQYQGFIPDNLGVDGYRKNWLEPVDQEIDHLGMSLLIDVLLKPIGFAVEIVYLDRSEGSQVNSHIMQEDSNGLPTIPGGPMIHLLYRPSHYDILYKDAAPMQLQAVNEVVRNPTVNRAANFTHQHSIQSTPMGQFSHFDMDTFLSIPGMSMPSSSHHGFHSQYQPPIEQTYAPSPISSMSPISPGASTVTTPSSAVLPASFPTQAPAVSTLTSQALTGPHQSFPANTALPIHPHLPPPPAPHRPTLNTHPSISSDLSSPSSAGSSFRPSKYEWEAAADWAQEGPVQFQTSTFKNSHYNTAHYNNPNFQPEEWSPEAEEQQMSTRKRST
ncbi:Ubiquitin thioesterase [Lachnellula occidentalis]|uniref:ubiquitinyl hydrolase 1 n=1 Tax=Lachnellula occidentalis TaxID=215460 RepID=A0A8H8RM76_9HELO|nr:Ubiquitin thioesterase [Lachnellula occidentalis]